MKILAVDPGYEKSAWVEYEPSAVFVPDEPGRIMQFGYEANMEFLARLRARQTPGIGRVYEYAVFEQIESQGMAVGKETFETVFWTGRFFEEALRSYAPLRITRRAVKIHLCQSARATDTNIRMALMDKFGGESKAKGTKAEPGPLYSIKSHLWAALAVAVTFAETGFPKVHGGESNGERRNTPTAERP